MGRGRVVGGLLLSVLGACTSYESAYERSVYDYEPLYCYQSLGAVSCYRQPKQTDARRLVNYYGPAPSKYPQPQPTEAPELSPPPKSDRSAVDPEPDPRQSEPSKATTSADDESDWKRYLPALTVVFGAAQLVAAFLF